MVGAEADDCAASCEPQHALATWSRAETRAGDGNHLRRAGGPHGTGVHQPRSGASDSSLRALARAHAERSRALKRGVMLRVDLHLHSHFSHDGRSSLQELIDRARECRLDRIALTDHNTIEGALNLVRLAPELAIAGEEVKTLEGEVIGLFITTRVPPFLTPEEAMDLIHGMGGLTYIPHPLDRHRANFRPERMVELATRIDIIESYNPWCDASANRAAAQLAEDLGKAQATGSDSHC